MHNVGSRSIWRRAGQMLSVLIVATLVVFGLGNNPSRAATPPQRQHYPGKDFLQFRRYPEVHRLMVVYFGDRGLRGLRD